MSAGCWMRALCRLAYVLLGFHLLATTLIYLCFVERWSCSC
jgi:hypothetical protein